MNKDIFANKSAKVEVKPQASLRLAMWFNPITKRWALKCARVGKKYYIETIDKYERARE